jgi:hypothetical protein
MDAERQLSTPRGLAWLTLIVGLGLGIGLGLTYAWGVDPVIERNTAPWQLGPQAREEYVVSVALSYAYNNDLQLAFDRLRALRPDTNVWDMVAEIACERHKTVKIERNSDVIVMRALEQLYRPQGASSCADGQYPTPAPMTFLMPTPTITPVPTSTRIPSKTPTPPRPTDTPSTLATPTPTLPPSGGYVVARVEPFCSLTVDGVIEVQVNAINGRGMPGVPVTVTWAGDETDRFFTGLKPGRDPGYGDFVMVQGRAHTVQIPELVSDPPVVDAESCEVLVEGETVTVTTSYRITFQQRPR